MDLKNFQWINETDISVANGVITLEAPVQTDRFNPPDGGKISNNAPFYYKELRGDFIMRAKVSMDCNEQYDGVGFMAFSDDTHWVKTCFEKTDFGTIAVVSVVTNGVSDDANGPNITQGFIWLQLAKKGDIFAVHYSLDGVRFERTRFCTIPYALPLKVGMMVQAPLGQGGKCYFQSFTLDEKAPEDIRAGK